MGIPDFDLSQAEGFKLSYDTVGLPLERDIYRSGLRADQKRSILRSIISTERKKSGIRPVPKHYGWSRFERVVRLGGADKSWQGGLTASQDMQRYNYLSCGKYGVREQNEKGETRNIVYHCNQLKRCPVCSKRYHRGRSYERGKIAAAVIRANKIKHLRKYELTLPDFLWDRFKSPESLRLLKKAANKMIQEFYGCPMKGTNGYLNGSVGVHIQLHPWSSEEAWRRKPHLHCYVIPLRVNGDHVQAVDRVILPGQLKELRRRWADRVKAVCRQLEYREIEDIPDELVIHHSYVEVPKDELGYYLSRFNFRYDQRSPVEDLEKAIKAIDFDNEQLIMAFSQAGYDYYAVWSFNDYIDQMLERSAAKGTNTTYGWLRRFRSNAKALGVEVKKEEDDFNPVVSLEVKTEYRRQYEETYDKDAGKFRQVKHLFVKNLFDPDRHGFWTEVDPWHVHGEEVWMPSKARYQYRVPLQSEVGDRGS